MKYDVDLSIYVPVYNHEKYIAQALDSIIMQKTKYSYEVWIGEDASTDNTKAVLEEYERKCPDNFHFIYREKNMHNSECRNANDLKLKCKGKYLICLEGDDFWTDENKIEKQIDFLEKHPEYIAVSHSCVVVDENSVPSGEIYPECTDNEYCFYHFASEIMPGHFTTVMTRNYMIDENFNLSLMNTQISPGDRLVYFSLLCHGKTYCMQEKMSAYRHITTFGSSYSANYKYDFNLDEKWHNALLQYAYKMNNRTAIKYAELLYFKCLGHGIRKKELSFNKFLSYFKNNKYKLRTIILYIKGRVNGSLLHKKIWY